MTRSLLRGAFWRLVGLVERLGLHVLPVHFYSPIPDGRELRRKVALFDLPHPMPGVDLRDQAQVALLETVVKPWEAEYLSAGDGRFGVRAEAMPSFAPANALTLYALVRALRPSRMVEVGSGLSTRVAAAAFRRNREEGRPGELIAIDPHPAADLRDGLDGLSRVVERPVESLPLDLFTSLGQGDILFIDSTHTVKIFGDVNFLFLTVLPQLRPGVLVHVHDVFLPLDYRPHHFFRTGARQVWQEQYLLHAFLLFNAEFEVLLGWSHLHLRHRERLAALFAWYHHERWPSSFWMRRRPGDGKPLTAVARPGIGAP